MTGMQGEIIDVVAAILWRDGRFLAAERPAGKKLAGFWEFPGGKLEEGENPEAALIRELDEELGVTPVDWRFWRAIVHEYPHMTVRLHFFHVPLFHGEPKAIEHAALAWLDPAENHGGINFLPVDRDILPELLAAKP